MGMIAFNQLIYLILFVAIRPMKNEKNQKIKIVSDLSFTIGLFTLATINYFTDDITES